MKYARFFCFFNKTDNVTGLLWQKQDDATTRTWADAGTYCSGLNLGGYSSGWRLPTPRELMSIANYDSFSPAINGPSTQGNEP
ncbi:DUF1566 domain-containing protein [Deltaproteobacteria bacterium TL4]